MKLQVTGPGGSTLQTKTNYITVTASGDKTPPGIPASPWANPLSSNSVRVSWMPVTDNVGVAAYRVERCRGAGCTSFAQVASVGGTAHVDSGLAPATTYRYRVRAVDAAGNASGYSSIATIAG